MINKLARRAVLSVKFTCLVCLSLLLWNNLSWKWTVDPLQLWSPGISWLKNKSGVLEQPLENVLKEKQERFLYMLQTESCLPAYLQEVIGDPSICPCDVSVLSFKTKCGTPPPLNVKYIFTGTRTSWGGGRNVLYEDAMTKREQIYLYYILMDDDIIIEPQNNESTSNPWRRFEEFLERVEPAAAALDIGNRTWLRRAARGRRKQGCNQSISNSSEYLSVARYDAAFNAFHNKTVRHILPYPTRLDRMSWSFPPLYINIRIEVMYAGHSVLHNQIFAINPTHKPYPRHWPNPKELETVIEEVANDLPEKHRNSSLLQGWRKHGMRNEQKSHTVCLPPPLPKMPIRQFAYLDGILDSLREHSSS